MEESTVKFVSKRFGIPEEDVLSYNSGSCYSRVRVRTKESANKVHKSVIGEKVNGGMLDGMPLGGISRIKNDDGEIEYDVTC